MKQNVKRVAVLLCCALALSLGGAWAAEGSVTVSVRVEGAAQNLAYEPVYRVPAGASALDAVRALLDAASIPYTATAQRLTAIGGEANGTFGGFDGWVWCLGNAVQTGAMSDYILTGGESLLVCYADPYGTPPTVLPYVSAARGADGRVSVTVTSQRTSYDSDWQLVYTTVPVADVTVQVGETAYRTDAAGQIVLSEADSAKDSLPLQLRAAAENGKPLVVRLAPDFALPLAQVGYDVFTDVPEGAWYREAVLALAARGAVNGFADYTFRPLKTLTRAEAVLALARLSGADLSAQPRAAFTDVPAGQWYTAAVDWAAAVGVVDGMGTVFHPNDPLSRQDLCLMLVRYSEKVLQKQLPSTGAAPAFTDNADIAPYAAEAVYFLQRACVVNGYGGPFLPKNAARRAEFCVMLTRLLAL